MVSNLKKEREGNATIETVLVFPFAIAIFMYLFFTCLLVISYVNYSSAASYLAKDLNFRYTGLAQAWDNAPKGNVAFQYSNNPDGTPVNVTYDQIYVNGKNGLSEETAAVAYNIRRHAINRQLAFPFARIDRIDVNIKNANSGAVSGKKHKDKYVSNSIIDITIRYNFNLYENSVDPNTVTGALLSGMTLNAVGMGVIT